MEPALREQVEHERARSEALQRRVDELEASGAQLESYAADLRRTYAEMRRHVQHMTVLHEASVRISSALALEDVVAGVLDGVRQLVSYERAALFLLDAAVAAGSEAEQSPHLWAVRDAAGKDVSEPDEEPHRRDVAVEAMHIRRSGAEIKGDGSVEVAVPLLAGGRAIGALYVHLRRLVPEEEMRTLELLAASGAVAVQNAFLYQETQRLATTDSLTGIGNHRYFVEMLSHEVDRARRMGYPVGFLMMDLDHFKQINDRFLHPTGNRVLKQVAEVLRTKLRRTDVVGRLGGEEFGAILPGAAADEVMLVAEKLRTAVESLTPLEGDGGPPARITMSVGAVSLATEAVEADLLEHYADLALYEAKKNGRNQVHLWDGKGTQ